MVLNLNYIYLSIIFGVFIVVYCRIDDVKKMCGVNCMEIGEERYE